MNNKGQTLVITLLLLPILIFLLALILDYGIIVYQKRKIDNNINYVINKYYEEELKEYEITKIINENIEYNEIDIKINEKIIIILNVDLGFVKNKNYSIVYTGTNESGKIIITKEMN